MDASDTVNRGWTAIIQYPGRKPVRFGTTLVRRDAPDHEVEAAIREDIVTILPTGYALLSMEPGAIFFVPEEPR